MTSLSSTLLVRVSLGGGERDDWKEGCRVRVGSRMGTHICARVFLPIHLLSSPFTGLFHALKSPEQNKSLFGPIPYPFILLLLLCTPPVLPEQARVEAADCSFDQDLCGWSAQNESPSARPSEVWRLATREGSVGSLLDHTFGADGGEREGQGAVVYSSVGDIDGVV